MFTLLLLRQSNRRRTASEGAESECRRLRYIANVFRYELNQCLSQQRSLITLDDGRLCLFEDGDTLNEFRPARDRRAVAQKRHDNVPSSGRAILQSQNDLSLDFNGVWCLCQSVVIDCQDQGIPSRLSFAELCSGLIHPNGIIDDDRLPCKVTALAACASVGDTPAVMVAGDEDGVIRVWHAVFVRLELLC